MADQNNPRALGSPREEGVAADSRTHQHARRRLDRSWRRRCRQTASECQGKDQPRAFRVYKFSSRAPPINVHFNGGGSARCSQIPALPDDGTITGTLARSASCWVKQERPPCWVRDCICPYSKAVLRYDPSGSHVLPSDLLDEKGSWTSPVREEFFSMDEDDDGSTGDTGAASSWADVRSDGGGRSLAAEYSLVPLNRPKYTAQTFHDAVERFLRGF